MTESIAQKTECQAESARKKLFSKNKWLFSVGGIGRDMLYQLISSFLMVYIQFGVPLSLSQFTTLSLIIGVGGRIWDAVNDPIMGAIIEGTHMKMGKFRPWIIIGALTCGLIVILMFNIQSLAGWEFVVFMCVMYLLWESTFTMNDIGYWSMLPSLSSVKKERNDVTMLTVLFAGIGAVIAQGLIPMVTTGNVRAAYRVVSIILGLSFIGCQMMTGFGVKETERGEAEKEEKVSVKKMLHIIFKNDQVLWITLSMLFYNIGSAMLVQFAANLLYTEIAYNGTLYTLVVACYGISSVFINIIYPTLASKLGRKKLQLISIIVAIIGYAGIGVIGWTREMSIVLLALFAIIISSGQSIFYTSSIINMTNCVEYNDYKQGERNEAVISTLRPFMVKFAGALQVLIVTIVLAVSGIYGLSQSVSTLEAQKGYFDRKQSVTERIEYIYEMNNLIDEVEAELEKTKALGEEEYQKAVAEFNEKIENSEAGSKYFYYKNLKINTQYVAAIKDVKLYVNAYDALGKRINQVYIGRFGEVQDLTNDYFESVAGSAARYDIEMQLGGTDSAADMNFKNKTNLSMRIWLRVSVSIVPIVCLLIALLIQRKKFIIDEDYYDMMLEEIAKRNADKKA
jgi:sugar (glycoside-pentoside-hexuronide) transporter